MGVPAVLGQTPPPNRIAQQLLKLKHQRSTQPLHIYRLLRETPNHALKQRSTSIVENASMTSMDMRRATRLISAKPALIQFEVPMNGDTMALELFRVDPVSQGLVVRTSDGQQLRTEGVHYRGIVKGNVQSIASISVFDQEIIGIVSSDQTGNVVIGRWDQEDTYGHIVYRDRNLKIIQDFKCMAVRPSEGDVAEEMPSKSTERTAANCVKVYFETSYKLYQNKGNNVNSVINYVTGLFNGVSTLYGNEGLGIEISEIFVWSSPDPFSHSSASAAMSSFRSQRPTFNGDLGHLLDLSGSNLGGQGYIDVLCHSSNNYAYSDIGSNFSNFPTYSWTVNVVTHEIGHNYGSPHTHACKWGPQGNQALDNCQETEGGCDPGPEPIGGGTIMSYCHFGSGNPGIDFNKGFGTEPGNLIRNRAATAGCLSACGSGGGGSCNLSITNIVEVDATCGENNGRLTIMISGASGAVTYDIGLGAQTSNRFFNLPPGTYEVTVVNGAGCEREATANISMSSSTPGLAASVTNATCGENDGEIELNASGGSSPYSYRLGSKTQSSPIFSNLPAGDYLATLTDNDGCSTDKQVTVYTHNAPTIQTDVDDTSCGETNGSVEITASGGQAPYAFMLANQESSDGTFEDLSPGTYLARVIDDNGCTDDQSITIDPSSVIEASAEVIHTTCGQADGSIQLKASGGNGRLRYSLGSGFTTKPLFESLASGTYTIRVRDNDLCLVTWEETVEASEGFDMTSQAIPTTCGLENGSITIVAQGLSEPFAYRLNGEDREVPVFEQLEAGSYTISATDANGCAQDDTVLVGHSEALKLAAEVADTRCGLNNGQIYLNTAFSHGATTFQAGNLTQSDPLFDSLARGTYMCFAADSLDCRDSITVMIDSSVQLQTDVVVNGTSCGHANGSIEFRDKQGVSPFVFQIESDGSNDYSHLSQDSMATSVPAGSYYLMVTDADDCIFTDTVEVAPSLGIDIEKSVVQTSCGRQNGAIEVRATGGVGSLSVMLDSISSADHAFRMLAAADYVLMVGDESGCLELDTIRMEASTSPILQPDVQHTSCGQANGAIGVHVQDGSAPFRYFLNDQEHAGPMSDLPPGSYMLMVMDTFACADTVMIDIHPSSAPRLLYESTPASCFQQNGSVMVFAADGRYPYRYGLNGTFGTDSVFSNLDSGSYKVQLMDQAGCEDSARVQVSYDDQFKRPAMPEVAAICDGQPVVLDPQIDDPSGTWQWYFNHMVLEDTTARLTASEPGTYILSVDYHSGCVLSDTTEVSIQSNPALTLIESDTICQGTPFGIDAVDDQVNYTWDNDSVGPLIRFATSGRYQLTVTSGYGCATSRSVDLKVIEPVALISASTEYAICQGDALQLNVDGAESYHWITSDPSLTTPMIANPLVTPTTPTEYRVIGRNACFADTLDLGVVIRTMEDVVSADTMVIEGSPLTLHAWGAQYAQWNSAYQLTCESCLETELRPEEKGQVFLEYDDRFGCRWQDTVSVDIIPLSEVLPVLVNVISPNGDGRNDRLVFGGLEKFRSVALQVFDQNGMRVYEDATYNNSWNGQFDGDLLPEGVYFYLLTLTLDDRKFHFDSDLTIIRD